MLCEGEDGVLVGEVLVLVDGLLEEVVEVCCKIVGKFWL